MLILKNVLSHNHDALNGSGYSISIISFFFCLFFADFRILLVILFRSFDVDSSRTVYGLFLSCWNFTRPFWSYLYFFPTGRLVNCMLYDYYSSESEYSYFLFFLLFYLVDSLFFAISTESNVLVRFCGSRLGVFTELSILDLDFLPDSSIFSSIIFSSSLSYFSKTDFIHEGSLLVFHSYIFLISFYFFNSWYLL